MYPKTLWNEAYSTDLVTSRLVNEYEYQRTKTRSRKKILHPLANKKTMVDAFAAAEMLRQFLVFHGKNGVESQPRFIHEYTRELC